MKISPEVQQALADNRPVVALESTIIAHGFPYPDNLELAGQLEQAVRDAGAIPATIAVSEGTPIVGIDEATLTDLAKNGERYNKTGATDLAVHIARGTNAATTVGATSVLAVRAGIRVFATGGIGGVHRGEGWDVSNDIAVLARTPIAVVSAGAKAILDIARTIEVLETEGVLVLGFGTDRFPAFYYESEHPIGNRVDGPEEVAAILAARFDMLEQGAVLVANPVPDDRALSQAQIDTVMTKALGELGNTSGKDVTPWLLSRLAEITMGGTVKTNRAVALNNARVAAEIAAACCARTNSGPYRQ
jgi:pseudouridine-5'-phosphate glycosidase